MSQKPTKPLIWIPKRQAIILEVLEGCLLWGINDKNKIQEIIDKKLKEYDDRNTCKMDGDKDES